MTSIYSLELKTRLVIRVPVGITLLIVPIGCISNEEVNILGPNLRIPGTVGTAFMATFFACPGLFRMRANESLTDVTIPSHAHSRTTLVHQILSTGFPWPCKNNLLSLRRIIVTWNYGSHVFVFLEEGLSPLSIGLSFGIRLMIWIPHTPLASSVLT